MTASPFSKKKYHAHYLMSLQRQLDSGIAVFGFTYGILSISTLRSPIPFYIID
uniref:Uncharacterized protein n=1 Tax=Lepeophtheirus salmonis TaxID=72036 RepID=A0A0K2VIS9_LEPSM